MDARVDPRAAGAGRAQLAAVGQQLDAGLLRLLDEAVGQLARQERPEVTGLAGDDLEQGASADRVELGARWR